MSTKIDAGNYQFSFNQAELREELFARGLDEVKIDKVLREIESGSLDSLEALGLADRVTVTWTGTLSASQLGSLGLTVSLEKMAGMNLVEIMQVLNEAARELRQASREMRHAERDAAMQESLNAADMIRSSALINLCFGVVSGAVNIGMGAFSIGSSAKQLVSMGGPGAEMKAAKLEMNQVSADADLGAAQMKLDAAQSDLDALALQEREVANLKTELAKADAGQKAEIQIKLDEAEAKLSTMHSKLEAELGLPGDGDPELRSDAIREKMGSRIGEMKSDIEGLAAKADSANNKQIASLEKSLENARSKLEKLDGKTGPDDVASRAELTNDVKSMQAKLDACKAKAGMYRNPTDPAHLAGAEKMYRENAMLARPDGAVGHRFSQAQAELNTIATKAQAASGLVQGVSTAAAGINQALKSGGDFAAAEKQAEQAEHTAAAQRHSSAESENADYQKGFSDLMQSALSLVKECLQAQNQANSAIYRNM